MHVGQAEVAALEAVRQLGVVQAQLVQDRRLQVVDVDRVLDHVVADLVGLAVDVARLHAAAGQPHRVGVDVVVAADRLAALAHRRAAELAAPDHQRAVEQAAPLQVLDQRRARPDRPPCRCCRAACARSSAAAVVVPVGVVELDEADAALDQPAGQQAVGREATACPASAPYRSSVSCVSFDRSISSGAVVCIR